MGRGAFLLFVLLAAAPSEAALRPLAASGRWAAFARDAPRSCYAISEPVQSLRPAGWKPFAAIGFWPDRRISGQVHFRLGREKRPGSAVLLRISDQTFQLIAGKADAWAPDRTADALIVAAMRSGVDMAIETRAANGTLVRESYQLAGAATAIDAAAVACARWSEANSGKSGASTLHRAAWTCPFPAISIPFRCRAASRRAETGAWS